jgi:hypothetical protein
MGAGVGGSYTFGRYSVFFSSTSFSSPISEFSLDSSLEFAASFEEVEFVFVVASAVLLVGGFGSETCGPIKKRWKWVEGKSMVNCSHAWGGKDDSARAPRTKTRT